MPNATAEVGVSPALRDPALRAHDFAVRVVGLETANHVLVAADLLDVAGVVGQRVDMPAVRQGHF